MSEQEFVIQDSWGDHLIAKKTADGGATLEYNNRGRSVENPNRFGQLTATDIIKLGKFFRGEIGGFSCDGLVTAETSNDYKALRVGNRGRGAGGLFLYWTPQMMAVPIKLFTEDLAAPVSARGLATSFARDSFGDRIEIAELQDGRFRVVFNFLTSGENTKLTYVTREQLTQIKGAIVHGIDEHREGALACRTVQNTARIYMHESPLHARDYMVYYDKDVIATAIRYVLQVQPATNEVPVTAVSMKLIDDWGDELTIESADGLMFRLTMRGHPRSWEPLGSEHIDIPKAQLVSIRDALLSRSNHPRISRDGTRTRLLTGSVNAGFRGSGINKLSAFITSCLSPYEVPVQRIENVTDNYGDTLRITQLPDSKYAIEFFYRPITGRRSRSVEISQATLDNLRACVVNNVQSQGIADLFRYRRLENGYIRLFIGKDSWSTDGTDLVFQDGEPQNKLRQAIDNFRSFDSYGSHCYIGLPAKLGGGHESARFNEGADRDALVAFAQAIGKASQPVLVDPVGATSTITGFDGKVLAITPTKTGWFAKIGTDGPAINMTDSDFERVRRGVVNGNDTSVNGYRVVDCYGDKIYFRAPGFPSDRVEFRTGVARSEFMAFMAGLAKTSKPAPASNAPFGFTVTGTDGDSLEVSGSGDAWKVKLRDEDGDTKAKHTFTRAQILRIAEGVRVNSDSNAGDLSRVVDTYAGKIYIRLGDYGEQVKFKRTELSALKSEFAKLETHLGVAVTVQNSGLSTPASAAAAAVQEQVNILSPITTQNWRGRGSIQTLVGCAGEVGLEVTQGDKTVELTLTLTQARQLVAKLNAAINN